MIKSRFQKKVSFSHLVNITNFENNNLYMPIKTTKGDLIIPVLNKDVCYGQLTIRNGVDLENSEITQVQHLIDLYFSIHVDLWTKDLHKSVNSQSQEVSKIILPEFEENLHHDEPLFVLIKSTNSTRSQYVLSYLQEKLNAIGSIPWIKNTITQNDSQDLSNIILQSLDLNSLDNDELNFILENWQAKSKQMPHVIIFHNTELSEYKNWNSFSKEKLNTLGIYTIDLDRLPIDYSYLKETIDLYLNL